MFTNRSIAVSLLCICFVSTSFACDDKKKKTPEAEKDTPTKSTKSDTTSSTKSDTTASSAPTGAPAGSARTDGVSKICEDYWAKSKLCNEAAIKSVPDGPAKEQMKKAFEDAEKQTREAWKAFEGKALDEACKTMIDSLKANPNCPKE